MCFSAEVGAAVGVALVPVGVLSLREVRRPADLPFAALPLLFAVHQLTEVLVWLGDAGTVSPCVAHSATTAYVAYAFPVLPTLLPLAVLMLQPRGARLRVAPFLALGLLVSVHLTRVVLDGPLEASVESWAIVYRVGLEDAALWTVLYVVATVGPALLSGHRTLVAFGLLNLVGLGAVTLLHATGVASLWCLWAAATSVLVLVHLRRRPRPDEHRDRERATPSTTPSR